MRDFVSRWINVVLLSASLLAVAGTFLPAFPWTGLLFVSVAASVSLWMMSRAATRSTAQVIWEVEAEPLRSAIAQGQATVPKGERR